MTDTIIIVAVIILVIIGVGSSKKHFKGQGGCCGGGGAEKVPKKKLGNVIGTKIVTVEGMTCDHCKARVEKCINEIEGASGKVNLSKKEAVVSMEREVSDDEIRTAIEKMGYEVVDIK